MQELLVIEVKRDKNNEWEVAIEKGGWRNTYELTDHELHPYWDAIDYMIRMAESTNAASSRMTFS